MVYKYTADILLEA